MRVDEALRNLAVGLLVAEDEQLLRLAAAALHKAESTRILLCARTQPSSHGWCVHSLPLSGLCAGSAWNARSVASTGFVASPIRLTEGAASVMVRAFAMR